MFFSPAKLGFYVPSINGSAIPPDAVEITPAQHAALLAAQSAGKRIVPDANGCPVAQDPPPPTADQIAAARVAAVQAHMDAAHASIGKRCDERIAPASSIHSLQLYVMNNWLSSEPYRYSSQHTSAVRSVPLHSPH